MFADLSGFPRTYVACGDEDSLLGQSLGMIKALAGHNVPTTASIKAGFDHGYQFLEDRFGGAAREMEKARDWVLDGGQDDVPGSRETNT
jgi:acetyl esterase